MTRWMHPPEAARSDERDPIDPAIEGARHGLAREVSLAIWERVRADATDAAGRLDVAEAHRRFHATALRIAARGGRLRPDVGRVTRVGVELEREPAVPDAWQVAELTARTPGRETQVMRSAERAAIDPDAAELVKRALGGGAPLDAALRSQLEAALGASLAAVRVHTDGAADAASRALGARAFALGPDVFFRAGAYDPQQRDGRWLIAHEVAHTVQARSVAAAVDSARVSQPGDALEHEADGFADGFVRTGAAGAGAVAEAGAGAAGAVGVTARPAVTGSAGPALIQRLDAKRYEGMDPVAAVGKALDDEKEDDAYELMAKLDAGQALQVLQRFQHKAVKAFNNKEMGKAARILVERGGPLDLALEWMFDEGTSWSLLRATVVACTSADGKAKVRTDHFRDLFVGEVNNKEMDELVDLLGGDIVFKLRWMFEEGTSFERVKAKITAVGPDERKLLQTQAWRDYFVKQFGNDEIAELAQLVGGDLPTKLLWMIDEGTDWKHLKAAIEGAPAETNKIIDDAWMKRFVKELGNSEMAELVKMLPLDLTKKLLWMKAEGTDWDLMKDVITSVPAPERVHVVENDAVRALFVSELGNAKMYEAVKLLGGKLAKQLLWMADEGCDDEWITERIASQPDVAERAAVYGEKLVVDRLRDIKPAKRVPIIKDLGGTPEQQMSVFDNDTPIALLTWATPPSADWVAAIMKFRKSPLDLLEVAKGDPATWGPLIQPKLYDLVKDFKDTLYPEDRVKVFWAAYGNGAAFTAPQILRFIGVLTGRDPIKAGETLKGRYKTRDPDLATAQEFMTILKPGGSSGAAGISRGELAMGKLAFCDQKKDDSGNWVAIDTSYFADPYIIIKVDAAGHMDTAALTNAADGTPEAVGTGATVLTYFQNHVRHEIGHAVGDSKVGNMKQKGDDFAEDYGGWESSSASDFRAAYWSDVAKPAAGWPSVPIVGVNVTLSNDDVKKWCVNLLDDGKEENNAIGKAPGTVQNKLAAIKGSLWSGVKMVDYLIAIGSTNPKDLRDNAYEFPNFTPTDPVRIYSTRWKDGFAKYSKAAWTAFKGISWYGLSSPAEMFAEMYTARYAQKTLPVAVNGKDPAAFFTELENQRDPNFGK